jgi:Flp pilus assembly protein CpaB
VAIQANKPNSRVFLLLGIVLAAAAAVAVLLLVRSNAPANEVSVVVSDASIPAGTTLTPAMVIVTQVPASAKPGDAFVDPVAVVGKTTTVALADNTPLVPAFFSTPALSVTSSGAGGTTVTDVETQITKGYVAVAIPTNSAIPAAFTAEQQANFSGDLVSAAGYILPGDHIDMLVQSTTGSEALRFTFQDLIVLRVGVATATTATASPGVLLVEVPRAQAALLTGLIVGAGNEFVVKYALRPESEWGKLAPDGSTYKPNYESAGSPDLPTVSQPLVTPGVLDSLFGH